MFLLRFYVDMWWRRFYYVIITIGAFVFYLFNGQWFSWILLLMVGLLPWLSLLLSLPSMLLTKAELMCSDRVPINSTVSVKLQIHCPLPTPPIKWKFEAYEQFSGKKLVFSGNAPFLADHCGSIRISLIKGYKYDYLGLFRIPFGRKQTGSILVYPDPLPILHIPSLKKYLAASWIPKPGGGFSENYDLREYRPGDDLRQIHWKLAAKTGKTVLREPIIPVRGRLVLSMLLNGTPDELDRKLGRLCYLSEFLLQKELPHEIQCASGAGIDSYSIIKRQDIENAVSSILSSSLTSLTAMEVTDASWHYRIGGDADEA